MQCPKQFTFHASFLRKLLKDFCKEEEHMESRKQGALSERERKQSPAMVKGACGASSLDGCALVGSGRKLLSRMK